MSVRNETDRDALVRHEGRTYRLPDLAHYMDHEQREAVHFADNVGTPQTFWDEFCRRFPSSAAHLVTIVPEVHPVEE